jgi:hypothetical protein
MNQLMQIFVRRITARTGTPMWLLSRLWLLLHMRLARPACIAGACIATAASFEKTS